MATRTKSSTPRTTTPGPRTRPQRCAASRRERWNGPLDLVHLAEEVEEFGERGPQRHPRQAALPPDGARSAKLEHARATGDWLQLSRRVPSEPL